MDELFNKIKNYTPDILDSNDYRKYSVLIPIIQKNGELHILFEVRSLQLRNQPGEICFPGGRIDSSDASARDAAIRETTEELRIPANTIENVYPIDYIIQPLGRRMIFPFVGFIKNNDLISPNPSEVKEIFTVPLPFLQSAEPKVYELSLKVEPERDFPFDLIPGGENYKWRKRGMKEYFYFYQDYCIWGLTALILRNFLSIIK